MKIKYFILFLENGEYSFVSLNTHLEYLFGIYFGSLRALGYLEVEKDFFFNLLCDLNKVSKKPVKVYDIS